MKKLSYGMIALGMLLLSASGATPVHAAQIELPAGAEALAPPAGHVPYLVLHARGVQIYTCNGDGTWNPASLPQADLYFDNGLAMGTHFGGPTWQMRDGSFVKAAKLKASSPDPSAIAWLQLQATTTGAGADGDRLAKTTYILRVNTVGGMAPAGGCTAGTTVSVPYEADYYFYRAGH